MCSIRVYIFYFPDDGNVTRIPYARWQRIYSGNETIKEFANAAIRIAHAYIQLENRKPVFSPRIEGGIYYFDRSGRIIETSQEGVDLLHELYESCEGVFDINYHRKKKAWFGRYCWRLNSRQIQAVIDAIW